MLLNAIVYLVATCNIKNFRKTTKTYYKGKPLEKIGVTRIKLVLVAIS